MHAIATMCRALGVSASGYYARLTRPPSARARADAELSARITAIHQHSCATYGAPRIHAELAAEGIHVGRKRVARLMANAGLYGVSRRRWVTTTVRDRNARPAPDLVERYFVAAAPNCLWVADITYIPTWATSHPFRSRRRLYPPISSTFANLMMPRKREASSLLSSTAPSTQSVNAITPPGRAIRAASAISLACLRRSTTRPHPKQNRRTWQAAPARIGVDELDSLREAFFATPAAASFPDGFGCIHTDHRSNVAKVNQEPHAGAVAATEIDAAHARAYSGKVGQLHRRFHAADMDLLAQKQFPQGTLSTRIERRDLA